MCILIETEFMKEYVGNPNDKLMDMMDTKVGLDEWCCAKPGLLHER